jgi:hypothetical protein
MSFTPPDPSAPTRLRPAPSPAETVVPPGGPVPSTKPGDAKGGANGAETKQDAAAECDGGGEDESYRPVPLNIVGKIRVRYVPIGPLPPRRVPFEDDDP